MCDCACIGTVMCTVLGTVFGTVLGTVFGTVSGAVFGYVCRHLCARECCVLMLVCEAVPCADVGVR